MFRLMRHIVLVVALTLLPSAWAMASELLDGSAFVGTIGPVENPDLSDRLYFHDGHFWSDICLRCGFEPGPYSAETTNDGVKFTGTLKSESRGQFDYEGIIRGDGSIQVTINWERRRWYWTSRREIAFRGQLSSSTELVSLEATRGHKNAADPDNNPLCARF